MSERPVCGLSTSETKSFFYDLEEMRFSVELLCSSFENSRNRIKFGVYPQNQTQCLQGKRRVSNNAKTAWRHQVEAGTGNGVND